MRMEVDRYGIRIIPETAQDNAYIEEVLGLKNGAPPIILKRANVIGMSALAHIETDTERKATKK